MDYLPFDFDRIIEGIDELKMWDAKLRYAQEYPERAPKALAQNATFLRNELKSAIVCATRLMKEQSIDPLSIIGYVRTKVVAEWLPIDARKAVVDSLTEPNFGKDDEEPFYVDGGYGHFWNEVELPDELYDLLCAYIDNWAKVNIPTLLGVQGSFGPTSEDAGGLSICDLSDIVLVFTSMSYAMDFFAKYIGTLDPVDIMQFTAGAWEAA